MTQTPQSIDQIFASFNRPRDLASEEHYRHVKELPSGTHVNVMLQETATEEVIEGTSCVRAGLPSMRSGKILKDYRISMVMPNWVLLRRNEADNAEGIRQYQVDFAAIQMLSRVQ